jgi:gliding-associated putative ABC transporter substrate-binding component GldG
MDKKKFGKINSIISIIGAICLLVVINILAQKYHTKADLTENKIYSLSDASKNILKKVDDNLIVKCFFSSNLPENYEINRKYLRDLLDEYSSYSNGKIKYEFIDPDTAPEWKDKLISIGVPKVQITGISNDKFEVKNIYMGVVFYYQDKKEVIPVLKSTKNLEYVISTIIKKLTTKKLPIVGLLGAGGTAIPEVELKRVANDLRTYLDVETERIVKYLGFQDDIDVLVVVNPRMKLSPWVEFQIDQYIMSGKPVIFLVDMVNTNFTLMTGTKNTTNINDFLKKYGVVVSDKVIADMQNQKIAIEKKVGNFLIQNTISYPFYPVFTNINRKYPFLTNFDALYFPVINKIDIVNKDNGTKIDWLFKSSPKSYLESPPYYLDPYQKFDIKKFNSGKEYIGGVIITGKLNSAFKGVDFNILKDKELEKKKNKEKYEIFDINKVNKNFISSTDNAKIIVIGDSDFIKDPLIDKTMESFFMNLLDYTLDNTGLINIRATIVFTKLAP